MTLPVLISVPHAGLAVPESLQDRFLLTPEQVVRDGDEGAATIYEIADRVAVFIRTDVARAVLDMNRAEDDRRRDGVVKTYSCWDEPIWCSPLAESDVERLLAEHHRAYHQQIRDSIRNGGLRFAFDCHTMAASAPPISGDVGKPRPAICLSNADSSCPPGTLGQCAECFNAAFELEVRLNDPFEGGYIIRNHSRELPWVQVELSRGLPLPLEEQRRRFLIAVESFLQGLG